MSDDAPARILIVEDDAAVAEVLAEQVRDLGAVVVGVANDLSSALALAEQHRADGAFVDLQLHDGPSGCQLAVALSDLYRLPVVIMSGDADQVPPGFAHALAVVEKPFRAADVKLAVTLVQRARSLTRPRVRARTLSRA